MGKDKCDNTLLYLIYTSTFQNVYCVLFLFVALCPGHPSEYLLGEGNDWSARAGRGDPFHPKSSKHTWTISVTFNNGKHRYLPLFLKTDSEALLQPNRTLVHPYWAACIFLLDLQLNVSFVSYLWVHSLGLISSLPPFLTSSNPVFYCLWKAFILCCPLVLSYQPHCQCCRLSGALHTMVFPLPSKHTSIFSKRGSQ